MSMKGKPDLHDVDKFIDGANSAQRQVSRKRMETVATKPEPTVQKLFRLPWDVANALKMEAAQSSVEQGRRVTETEIVEELIRTRCQIIDR